MRERSVDGGVLAGLFTDRPKDIDQVCVFFVRDDSEGLWKRGSDMGQSLSIERENSRDQIFNLRV